MYPKNLKDIQDAGVRARIGVERQIVRSLVKELLSHSHNGTFEFELAVMDGEEQHPRTTNADKVYAAIMETDEDYLFVYKMGETDDGETFGWVRLTYGNDGWDVMSDWTTNLDSYIPDTLALVEKLS